MTAREHPPQQQEENTQTDSEETVRLVFCGEGKDRQAN